MLECLVSPHYCCNRVHLSHAASEINIKMCMTWRLSASSQHPGKYRNAIYWPILCSIFLPTFTCWYPQPFLCPPVSFGLLCGSPGSTNCAKCWSPAALGLFLPGSPELSCLCVCLGCAVAAAWIDFRMGSAPWRFILFRTIYWDVHLLERKCQMLKAAQSRKSESQISVKYVILFIVPSKQFYVFSLTKRKRGVP